MKTCYCNEVRHRMSDGRTHHFRPRGPTYLIDDAVVPSRRRSVKEDRIEDWGAGGLAARIFVGLNVGDKPTYTIQQVVKATKEIRRNQGVLPDATFIAQKGLYTESSGGIVEENSVQIIIFDSEGSAIEVFGEKVVQLARGLRERFNQDSVIVELQKAGVSQDVMAVKRE